MYFMKQVNMCHGSKCMNDAMKYSPYVAAMEMTSSLSVLLVSTSLEEVRQL